MRRALRYLLIAVFACLTAFLVTNWIVTGKALIRLINGSTDDIEVQYASASGTVLTSFKFVDLEVRSGPASEPRWKVRFDEVSLRAALLQLLRKTFETSWLEGSGLRFEMALQPGQRIPPSPPDSWKGNWRIRLRGLRIHSIHGATVGTYQLPNGPGTRLEGGFYLHPGRELEIFPTRYRTSNDSREIDLGLELERMRFDENPGAAWFRRLTARLRFRGEYGDLRFFNYYFQAVPWLRIAGGDGRVDADLRVQRGIVSRDSRLELQVRRLALGAGRFRARGSGRIVLKELALGSELRDFRLLSNQARGKRLRLEIRSERIDLTDPLARATGVELTAERLRGKALGSRILTDLSLRARVGGVSTHEKTFEVRDLTLALTRLSLTDLPNPEDPEVENWSGGLALPRARMRTGGKPYFSAEARLAAVNGKPLFAALENADLLPINLAGVIPLNELRAGTRVAYDTRGLSFDDIAVTSSTVRARGSLRFKDGKRYGNLRFDTQPVAFGLKLNGTETELTR